MDDKTLLPKDMPFVRDSCCDSTARNDAIDVMKEIIISIIDLENVDIINQVCG